MSEKQFLKLSYSIKRNSKTENIFVNVCVMLPRIIMIVYITCILLLLFRQDVRVLRYTAVPLFGLVSATILRRLTNRRRPFELYNIKPLIPHEKGKSFPSKHAKSSMVIAVACVYIDIWLGLIMIVLSIVVGATRVIAAIHFPADVFAGWMLGALIGYIGFFLI